MGFVFGNMNSECSAFKQAIVRCPFLRNINEPTNFSFSTSMSFPMPVSSEKGPIFEDGPNFDMLFKLFHGQNGVVPLSERSFIRPEKSLSEPSPAQFNPLAAKAATISLSAFGSAICLPTFVSEGPFSAFGSGGPFGFDAFSKKWISEKKSNSKKESSSKKGESGHEAMNNEWLQSGNCLIAKSYRAATNVLPLVAKALQPPPGVKIRCPPAIVATRSALSITAFAINLQAQPLPAKVLIIGMLGMAANATLGVWRENTKKFSKSGHEAMSNEWLQSGNCPIAKSYRAVNHVLPLVAKALQPPPGVKIRCPPAIVAARAAISKTAFAKNLRPQPLPAKVLVIGMLGMAANVPLGVWREDTKVFSPSWFVAVHAAPFIGILRKSVLMPNTAVGFAIAASILTQVIGSRAERHRLQTVGTGKMVSVEAVVARGCGVETDSSASWLIASRHRVLIVRCARSCCT